MDFEDILDKIGKREQVHNKIEEEIKIAFQENKSFNYNPLNNNYY